MDGVNMQTEADMTSIKYRLAIFALISFPFYSFAGNHHVVTIPGGSVHFSGGVVNAACAVDTNSEAQTVEMGQIRTNEFTGTGSWSDPQPFSIVLKDCDTTISQRVGISFDGTTDAKEPDILAVSGGAGVASGIGIGIFDNQGNQIIPNAQAQAITTIEDSTTTLNFIAKYRSTSNNVLPGKADAETWFTLTYM